MSKQLFFQSFGSDSEVDDGHLGLNLRGVVRVGVGSGQEQLEIVMITDLFVSYSDALGSSTRYHILLQYRLQSWVQIDSHVFNQGPLSKLHLLFNASHQIGTGCFYRLEPFILLDSHAPYVLVALGLGVYQQRPPPLVIDDDAILDALVVLRKPIQIPAEYFDWIAQELAHPGSLCMHQSLLLRVLPPKTALVGF